MMCTGKMSCTQLIYLTILVNRGVCRNKTDDAGILNNLRTVESILGFCKNLYDSTCKLATIKLRLENESQDHGEK